MIHAFLFITVKDRDRDGHGEQFQSHMHRINKAGGYRITIYHSFMEEVAYFQQHHWKCEVSIVSLYYLTFRASAAVW